MCKLTADEDALIIDWSPVDPSWGKGRLQYVCVEESLGVLEAGEKFWKLGEEYFPEKGEQS